MTGVILAAAGVASDETSIDTDSVTAIAVSAANVTLLVFISRVERIQYIKTRRIFL